jgi:hypothetical protein
MENIYLQEMIARIERELEKHQNGKYAGNVSHEKCTERLESTICTLKAKLDSPAPIEPAGDFESVRGDEFEGAVLLDRFAEQLEVKGKKKEAAKARSCAKTLVAMQLNEFDGFCR